MKKILLGAFMAILTINTTNAQMLEVLYADSVIDETTDKQGVRSEFTFKNISGRELLLGCERTKKEMAPQHDTYFCFGGICNTPNITVSPVDDTLSINEEYNGFFADLDNEFQTTGTSKVYYSIFEKRGAMEKFEFYTVYNISNSVGIRNKKSSAISIYPNPAKNEIFVRNNNTNNLKIAIYDITGQLVKTTNISNVNGTTKIAIDELPTGLYFINSIENNILVDVQKITISK